MSNIYTFNKDNIINNLTGGYKNVYEIIKESIGDSYSKEYYDPKEREETCKTSTEFKLRCDSGKLLKYLIRMELKSYEKAKKNNKDVIKEKYLKIVKPYILGKDKLTDEMKAKQELYTNKIEDINRDVSECDQENILEKTQIMTEYRKNITDCDPIKKLKIKQKCLEPIKKKYELKLKILENKEKLCKKDIKSRKSSFDFINDKKDKKYETRLSEINKLYVIDITYIQNYFKNIRVFMKKLVDLLDACPLLKLIDQDSLSKGLIQILISEVLKDLQAKQPQTEKDKSNISVLTQLLATMNESAAAEEDRNNRTKWEKVKGFVVDKKDKLKGLFKNKVFVQGAATALGVSAAIGAIVIGVAYMATPWGALSILGSVIICYALWKAKDSYDNNKYGKNIIEKKEFVRNLSMFALNKQLNDTNLGALTIEAKNNHGAYNPFNENSVLQILEDDLIKYLKDINTKPDCTPGTCIINVKELCVRSVDKDCPFEEDGNQPKLSDEKLKEYKTQRDLKKRITKEILRRMGEMFDSIGELEQPIEENIIDIASASDLAAVVNIGQD
jgi:hypothetical protein